MPDFVEKKVLIFSERKAAEITRLNRRLTQFVKSAKEKTGRADDACPPSRFVKRAPARPIVGGKVLEDVIACGGGVSIDRCSKSRP